MLELWISDETVDLSPDATISIEEESPVFNKDSIPGGYSFPFSLPVTPKNRRILGFPERIEKAGKMSNELPFQLFQSGKLYASGTITVTQASSSYKASLLVRSGDFASKIAGKYLKDLDLGGVRTWVWKTEYKSPADDFALAPIFNTEYYADTDFDTLFKFHKCKINAFYNGEFYHPVAEDDPWVVTPFPFLTYLIGQIFSFAGFNIVENVLLTDPDFKDLVLYTLRDISHMVKAIVNEEYYSSYDQFGNPISLTGPVIYPSSREITTFDLRNSMPEITISEFLLSVRNLLNLAYIVESDTVRIIKRQDLLFKSPAIDITDSVVDNPVMVSITTDGAKLEWEVDSNDDLWGEDYFKNLDDYLDFVKTPLNTVAELEALIPAENEIRYVAGVNLYFRYVYFAYDPEDDTLFRWQWVSWSYNFQNYRCGNVEDVFTNSFAPMLEIISRHTSGEVSGMQRGPFVSQKGAINSNGTMPSFAPRLMFYRGLTPDSLGANYPYLTNDNLDRVGTVIPGKCLALRFEGQYGIFEQLWSKYMTWYLTRKQVTWIIQDPSQLSFNQKYSINGNHYLLKSRSIGMSVNSINPEECQFYLV